MTNKLPDQYFNRSNNTQLEDDHIVDDNKKVEDNRFADVGETIK